MQEAQRILKNEHKNLSDKSCVESVPLCSIECCCNTKANYKLKRWLFAYQQQPDVRKRIESVPIPLPKKHRKTHNPNIRKCGQYTPMAPSVESNLQNILYSRHGSGMSNEVPIERRGKRMKEYLVNAMGYDENALGKMYDMHIYREKPNLKSAYEPLEINDVNPNWANYMENTMDSNCIQNQLLGINFYTVREVLDKTDKYLDLFELAEIFEIIANGGSLTPAQLQYLMNFLKSAAKGKLLFDVMRILQEANLINPLVLVFLRNIVRAGGQIFSSTDVRRFLKTFQQIAKLDAVKSRRSMLGRQIAASIDIRRKSSMFPNPIDFDRHSSLGGRPTSILIDDKRISNQSAMSQIDELIIDNSEIDEHRGNRDHEINAQKPMPRTIPILKRLTGDYIVDGDFIKYYEPWDANLTWNAAKDLVRRSTFWRQSRIDIDGMNMLRNMEKRKHQPRGSKTINVSHLSDPQHKRKSMRSKVSLSSRSSRTLRTSRASRTSRPSRTSGPLRTSKSERPSHSLRLSQLPPASESDSFN